MASELIHEFTDALNTGDTGRILSITGGQEDPEAWTSLFEAGATFEASACRPTRTDRGIYWETENSDNDNSIIGLMELECHFGYTLEGDAQFDYDNFLYKDGVLYGAPGPG